MTVYTAYYTLVNPYKYRSILNPKHQVLKAFYPSFVLSLQESDASVRNTLNQIVTSQYLLFFSSLKFFCAMF